MIENEIFSDSYGERYHLIVNNILDVVGELDLNGIFTYVNPYIYDELGYQPDKLIGREIYDIVHPDDIKKITKVLLRSTKHHGFISEIRLKNDNNQFIWYEIKARRVKDYNRQKKILITLKNISKFKELEQKLRDREKIYQDVSNSIPEIQFWKMLTPRKHKKVVQTSFEMLQIIINNIPQCIFWKDLNFKYLGCNHSFVKFLDLESPEDIIGKRDEDLFVTKEKIKMINDNERKVIITGESEYHFHEFWVKNNGKEICLDINRVPLIDSDEDIVGVLCTFEEITDRKITEEKLQKSEEKYKKLSNELETIIELFPGMIFVKDKDDLVTRVNQYFADSLELNKEEIIGKSTFDLFPKDQATAFRNDDLDILNSGKPKFNIEETADFPSGKISTITSKVPYYKENEEIDGIIGLSVDITERKFNEQKLRESEDKYKNLFEQCPLAMLLINFDGTIEDCNTPLETLFGYNKQEVLGHHFLKLNAFHSDSIPLLIKGFKEFLKTGVPEHSEIQAYKKDGKIVWISSYPIVIKIAGISYIHVMIQDITSRKIAEQKLKESEEQLRLERDNLKNILNSMKDGVYIVNQHYDIEYVNTILIEEFGLFEKKKCFEYFHDREEVCPWCKNQEVFAGKTVRWEWFSFKNHKTYDLVDTLLKNPDGSVSKLEIFHDITERKKSEEIILASERKLKNLMEAIPIGISISNPEGEISEINTQAYKIFSYSSKEEFLKLPAIVHYYNPKDREKYVKLLKSGLVKDFEVQFKRKDGTLFWGSLTSIAQRIGDRTTLINTFQDITDRKKTEEEVADLAKFPEENPNPVLRVSKEFVLYANQSGQDLLNIKIGNRIPILLREVINKAFEENVTQNLEVALNTHIYSLFVTPIKGTSYINVYGLDITERKKTDQKLIESEKKYKALSNELETILDLTPSIIAYKDTKNNFVRVNKYLADAHNMTKKDMEGKSCFDLYPPEDAQNYWDDDLEIIKGGKPKLNIEEPWESEEGTRWVSTSKIPYIDENGEVKGILGIAIDITERKKKEEEIRLQSEIIENMSEGVYLIKRDDGIIVYTNPAFEEMFGYEPNEMIGKNVSIVNAPTDKTPEETRNEIMVILSETGEWHGEVLNIKKDGTPFWCYANVSLFDHPEYGRVIISVHTDITDRKEKEEEARLHSEIMTNMSEGVYLIRLEDLIIVYANPRFEEMFGYDPGEMIGKYVVIVNAPTDKTPEETKNEIVGTLKDKGEWHGEVLNIKKDGTPFWCYANVSLFDHPEYGRVIVSVHTDITERKKKEEEIRLQSEIIENMSEGVYLIKRDDGIIVYTNPAFEEMFGYEPNEMIGKNVSIVNAPTDKTPEETRNEIMVILSETGEWHGEVLNIKKDGTPFWCYANVSLFDHPEYGRVIVSVHTDITERIKAEQALKESEEKFRNMSASAQDAIIQIDDNGKVRYWNKAAERIFQYTDKEILGKEMHFLLMHKKYNKIFKSGFSKFKETGQGKVIGKTLELDARRKDGIEFPIEISISAFKLKERWNSIGILRDITERKEVEQKLKESEGKYRSLVEDAQEGVWALDKNENTIFTNEKIVEMLGYTRSEMMGKNLYFFIPDSMKKLIKSNRSRRERGVKETYDLQLVKKDGTIIYTNVKAAPIMDENRNYKGSFAYITDITQRKIAEQMLKESEEKFREIAEQSLIGIQILQDNRTKYVNQQWAEISGFSIEDITTWNVEEHLKFIHPENREYIKQQLFKKLKGDLNVTNRYQAKCIKKTGETIWVEVFAKTINFEGKFADLIMIVDITEKKELDEIKSNLLTRFSHEFKTPLISIKGFTDLLLTEYAEILDEKTISFLYKIKDGGNRLKSLINIFIEGTQLDKDLIKLDLKQENLSKLVKSSLKRMEGAIKMREHSVDLNILDELNAIVDKDRIESVFTNLLINSINYTPKGGNISIQSRIKGNSIIVSVKDNGIGLTKEEINKLFEPFGKIERYGKHWDIISEGMGMGLYISKEIIDLHGGKIWAESDGINKGSKFSFSLPIVKN